MQGLLNNLTSIQWWIGVVVVGICINIISYFVIKRFDGYLSNISTWWRNKSKKRKNEFESDVNALAKNHHEIINAQAIELRFMNRAIYSLLMGILSFILGLTCTYVLAQKITVITLFNSSIVIMVYLSAALSMISSMMFYSRSVKMANMINKAIELIKIRRI